MKNDNISTKAKDLMELFQNGDLIARALPISDKTGEKGINGALDAGAFDKEMAFLNQDQSLDSKRFIDKDTGNLVINPIRLSGQRGKANSEENSKFKPIDRAIERSGQRSRSATLLVEDVEMSLIADIGMLYDANKTTIRGYMLHDSSTMFQYDNDQNKLYNTSNEKDKFLPVLSKKDFIDQYKTFRNNPISEEMQKKIDDSPVLSGNSDALKYNEIIGNFFPESLTGLVAKDDSPHNKLKLLHIHNHMLKEHGVDLPMVIMDKGKIKVWEPTTDEIKRTLDHIPDMIKTTKIGRKITEDEQLVKLSNEFANKMGYDHKISLDKSSSKSIKLEKNSSEAKFSVVQKTLKIISNLTQKNSKSCTDKLIKKNSTIKKLPFKNNQSNSR